MQGGKVFGTVWDIVADPDPTFIPDSDPDPALDPTPKLGQVKQKWL